MEKKGNPAVVGLAGFGLTTLLLQLHNLGLIGLGPVVAAGFIFGGLAQLIAGFQENKAGNNFGYSAFVSYGAFWIGLVSIWVLNHFGIYESSSHEIGYFLFAYMLYTGIMLVASTRIHTAMFVTFFLLFAGFALLVLEIFFFPALKTVAAIDLILCAFSAWYMMAGAIINPLAGKEVLPMGKPLVK
ncbi:MAG: acetate uptake transporter [Tannerellaceae bacterium]|nr:hypothetical protein [Porphyromonadaceae bacterium]